MLLGLVLELLGSSATFARPQQAGVGQLASGCILADTLAGLVGAALHVQQIIGDLEGSAETAAEAVQPLHQHRIRCASPFALGREKPEAQIGRAHV